MPWTLTAGSPFSLDAVIDSHGWVQLAPFVPTPAKNAFDYTCRLATSGRVVTFSIKSAPQGIRVNPATELTRAEGTELRKIASWMVGLDIDLSAFYEHTRHEPRLAHMESRAKGRFLRSATVYEDLIKTILTTNTTWAGTIRMNNALVTHFGEPGPEETNAFPQPARLAELAPSQLSTAIRAGYRVPYILEVSRAVAAGTLDLEPLKSADMPTEEARKFLLSIKGVGDYAAANMLLLLGHYDFVPVDSIAIKSVGDMWHDGARIGPKEIYAAFESWRPYRGLAYWFWDWGNSNI